MALTCKLLGHRWVFRHLTIPRVMFCARCGRRSR